MGTWFGPLTPRDLEAHQARKRRHEQGLCAQDPRRCSWCYQEIAAQERDDPPELAAFLRGDRAIP